MIISSQKSMNWYIFTLLESQRKHLINGIASILQILWLFGSYILTHSIYQICQKILEIFIKILFSSIHPYFVFFF